MCVCGTKQRNYNSHDTWMMNNIFLSWLSDIILCIWYECVPCWSIITLIYGCCFIHTFILLCSSSEIYENVLLPTKKRKKMFLYESWNWKSTHHTFFIVFFLLFIFILSRRENTTLLFILFFICTKQISVQVFTFSTHIMCVQERVKEGTAIIIHTFSYYDRRQKH